jgi:hypothetical protein
MSVESESENTIALLSLLALTFTLALTLSLSRLRRPTNFAEDDLYLLAGIEVPVPRADHR